MTYDCIIIGGGIGGLTSAAYLAKGGAKVLLCHRFDHLGGTATEFRRGEFTFPAGPLSFSFHDYVAGTLRKLGVCRKIGFQRAHFQYKCPGLDIIISQPYLQLAKELSSLFPSEKEGIESFFKALKKISEINYRNIEKCAGTFLPDEKDNSELNISGEYEKLSADNLAGKFIKNGLLKTLLSSQSFEKGEMSAALCANMWDMMCERGIWYPAEGFANINNMLGNAIENQGGEIRLSAPVKEILIKNNSAAGVKLENGESLSARFVISNADYKNTFLKMSSGYFSDRKFLKWVEGLHDSGSIFCVYLGVDSSKVDFTPLRAEHLFYKAYPGDSLSWSEDISSKDFFLQREFEICRWSKKNIKSAPDGKDAVVLRTNAPYAFFKKWEKKEGGRPSGYYKFKYNMTDFFIKAAGHLLEGLEDAVETVDSSTPLTYERWSGSSEGACAGWSWNKDDEMGGKLRKLIKTPVNNLYMAGYQAFSQLFMGGFATAMRSGEKIAQEILNKTMS